SHSQLRVEFSRQVCKRVAGLCRRPDRAEGVVLVDVRQSEDGRKGVAGGRVDGSAVSLDGRLTEAEDATSYPAQHFRVELPADRRRDLEAEEEGRHGLACVARHWPARGVYDGRGCDLLCRGPLVRPWPELETGI